MLGWASFLNACFFITLAGAVCAGGSFFQLLLTAELTWIFLYALIAVWGTFCDEASLFSLVFFILGFAAAELCFGLLLILLMQRLNLSLFLTRNSKRIEAKLFKHFSRLSTRRI